MATATNKTTELAKAAPGTLDYVKGLVESKSDDLRQVLVRGMDITRLKKLCISECVRVPELMKCTPQSLLLSFLECAKLGLYPGTLGECYILPYKGVATFIPGYRGYVTLARRSGTVSTIQTECVYEGDEFDYAFEFGAGKAPFLRHKPSDDPKRLDKKLLYAWAGIQFKDGSSQFKVLNRAELEATKARSPAARSSSSPWNNPNDFPAMCMKTSIRRLMKLCPLSTEMERAISLDDSGETGTVQEAEYAMDNEPRRPGIDALADSMDPQAGGESQGDGSLIDVDAEDKTSAFKA